MGLIMVLKGHGSGRFKGALSGGNIWWVAPSSTIYDKIWRDLKRACRGGWVEKSETHRRIDLPGGGSVTVKSADRPESLVGDGLDGVVIDEAAIIKEETWKVSIRPALSDKAGWAVFIGTPKGFNWFYELFQAAEVRPNWQRWQHPTIENPLISAAELADAQTEGSFAFSQEYLAQFVADGLGMFQRGWLPIIPALPSDVKRACRGWDNAGTEGGGDYSAGVLISEHEGMYYVVDVRRGQWSPANRNREQDAAARDDNSRFPGMMTWVEEEGGSAGKEAAAFFKERMRKMGFLADSQRVTDPKGQRAAGLAAEAECGNVKLIAGP